MTQQTEKDLKSQRPAKDSAHAGGHTADFIELVPHKRTAKDTQTNTYPTLTKSKTFRQSIYKAWFI